MQHFTRVLVHEYILPPSGGILASEEFPFCNPFHTVWANAFSQHSSHLDLPYLRRNAPQNTLDMEGFRRLGKIALSNLGSVALLQLSSSLSPSTACCPTCAAHFNALGKPESMRRAGTEGLESALHVNARLECSPHPTPPPACPKCQRQRPSAASMCSRGEVGSRRTLPRRRAR